MDAAANAGDDVDQLHGQSRRPDWVKSEALSVCRFKWVIKLAMGVPTCQFARRGKQHPGGIGNRSAV